VSIKIVDSSFALILLVFLETTTTHSKRALNLYRDNKSRIENPLNKNNI